MVGKEVEAGQHPHSASEGVHDSLLGTLDASDMDEYRDERSEYSLKLDARVDGRVEARLREAAAEAERNGGRSSGREQSASYWGMSAFMPFS